MTQGKKHVLVTGGAGFIGSHLVELLVAEGHHVTVVDNLSIGRLSNLDPVKRSPLFQFIELDIRDREALAAVFEQQANGFDWVFHLAALADIVPSIETPDAYYTTNVDGTYHVVNLCHHYGVKRLCYAASSSCYGLAETFPTPESAPIQPQYPYALTKRMGEELILHWAQVYGLPANALRLFNVYGPRVRTTGTYGAVFGVFLAQKLYHKPFTIVGNGQQSRDFTFVTDVAKAFMQLADSSLVGETLNVGSGHHYSVNRLVELLCDGDENQDITYIPKRPGEPDMTFADVTQIQQKLGWTAQVSFEQGVQVMLDHIQDWTDAPLWEPKSIEKATASWFQYLDK